MTNYPASFAAVAMAAAATRSSSSLSSTDISKEVSVSV